MGSECREYISDKLDGCSTFTSQQKVSHIVVSNCFVLVFDVSNRPEGNLGQPPVSPDLEVI